MDFIPTYEEYRRLLSVIKETGKLMDYQEALGHREYIILRHDIEFSIERALKMSYIESEMGIATTYFVQIRNDAYNAFSFKNIEILRNMHRRGHHIGRHYHIGETMVPECVAKEIAEQCDLLQYMTGIHIDRYSMHRPKKETRYFETEIPGKLNAYGACFFAYSEDVKPSDELNVKYISDAKHQWNYGTPDDDTLYRLPRIQLLVHPDYWSDTAQGTRDNFSGLISEHSMEYIDTLDNECNHFGQFREKFQSLVAGSMKDLNENP